MPNVSDTKAEITATLTAHLIFDAKTHARARVVVVVRVVWARKIRCNIQWSSDGTVCASLPTRPNRLRSKRLSYITFKCFEGCKSSFSLVRITWSSHLRGFEALVEIVVGRAKGRAAVYIGPEVLNGCSNACSSLGTPM